MKRVIPGTVLLLAVTIALTTVALAGGAFDGNWSGTIGRGSGGGSCKALIVNFAVAGNQVSGSVKHSSSVADVSGTVADDGSFKGKAGTAHVDGKFAADGFTGTYHSGECGDRDFTMSKGG
jgi:hypothetical protein